jgi:hypothetical protein
MAQAVDTGKRLICGVIGAADASKQDNALRQAGAANAADRNSDWTAMRQVGRVRDRLNRNIPEEND